jgi:DNA repair protein RecN (Recombination protein N)
MLCTLAVRDFAIIERVEVELGPGLNVVTGETGAGKSILVHALQLVLGARARTDAVRTGAEEAEVEALFSLDDLPDVHARLAAHGLPADRELVIRRVVAANGRTRAYVNGRLATVAQLAALATGLVDLSSQHEHHSLADAANHLGWLDAFARHDALIGDARASYDRALAADRAQRELAAALMARAEREELVRFQLAEIDRFAPKSGEDVALREEVDRLRHAGALGATTQGVEGLLRSGEAAVGPQLSRAVADLRSAARKDPRLAPIAEQVESARVELEDAAHELGRYAAGVALDPERLEKAEERMHALSRLARRFGGDLDGALAQRAALAAELAVFDDADGACARSEGAARAAAEAALSAARRLSASRANAAQALGKAISAELASLAMGDAEVRVELLPLGASDGPTAEGVALGPRGIDRAEFLIAPNRGEEPRPLRRVASGGELSRSLLAIKRVLAGLGPVGTYVFDEVDSGIGGAVADVLGRKLAEVARHHQVICITHQAQIAAWGTTHWQVAKAVADGRTRSAIRHLGAQERVEEIARMLGGQHVTEAARRTAAELLERQVVAGSPLQS